MKTTLALLLALTLVGCGRPHAPSPPDLKSQIPPPNPERQTPPLDLKKQVLPPDLGTQYQLFRDTPQGKALEFILSGNSWSNINARDDLVEPFQMKSFRSGQAGQVQLIAQAPECHIDRNGKRAWDTGPIALFTPTTNIWLQGEGFLFIETNHLLYISNKVETRIVRSLLKTTMTETGGTNAPGEGEQILKIFSSQGQFDYESNFAVYRGSVHVIDVQLDLTSDRLTIHFTTNGAVQTILADGHVVMTTTNNGQTTSATAFYYVTNDNEMMELTGQATWRNGDEQAEAGQFIYDRTHHFLTGIGDVRVCWPNAAPGAEDRRTGAPPRAGPRGFRELSADFATLQMPPTNGPVEAMHAMGNVVIVNDADASHATGEQADYARTNDVFELTGHPEWRTDQMEIKGRVLTAELTNNVYHARGDSHIKLKVAGAAHTNQWLDIDCADFDYQTNHAEFHDDVKTRLLEDGVLRDTLNSDFLEADLVSNQVKTAVAQGDVRGQTAPDQHGNIKTVACGTLTLHRSPANGMTKDIVAQDHVVLQEFGTDPAAPHNKLTAVTVTAWFSAVVTNQMERAVAMRDVVFDQVKTNQTLHATGQQGVYTAENDEVKLTGDPVARTEQYLITDASYLIFYPKTNRFSAFGAFRMSNPALAHLSPKP